jgi:hypothetical protein
MPRQPKRIISGKLLNIPGKAGSAHKRRKAVLAEHPVPLTSPNLWAYDLKLRRWKLVPAHEPPELKLPDFEALKGRDG